MVTETLKENSKEISTKARNFLQIAIIKELNMSLEDSINQAKWLSENAKNIAKLIDDPENIEVRDLINSGEYNEAAKFVIKALSLKNEGGSEREPVSV